MRSGLVREPACVSDIEITGLAAGLVAEALAPWAASEGGDVLPMSRNLADDPEA